VKPSGKPARSSLSIKLFGGFDCRIDGHEFRHFRSRKSRSLFALLIVRSQTALQRRWLAATLWPDSSEERSRFYLRRELSAFRTALGSQGWRIESPSPDTVRFNISDAEIDLVEFDALCAEGGIPAMERALQLYQGPLLEDYDEEWLTLERAHREQGYILLLAKLAEHSIDQGAYDLALSLLRRAIAMEPLRESLHRSLIHALGELRDYGSLAVAYRRLKSLLRKELGTEPDPKTQQLVRQIQASARSSGAVKIDSHPPALLPKHLPIPHLAVELIGRDGDVRNIDSLFDKYPSVVLTGPGELAKRACRSALPRSFGVDIRTALVSSALPTPVTIRSSVRRS